MLQWRERDALQTDRAPAATRAASRWEFVPRRRGSAGADRRLPDGGCAQGSPCQTVKVTQLATPVPPAPRVTAACAARCPCRRPSAPPPLSHAETRAKLAQASCSNTGWRRRLKRASPAFRSPRQGHAVAGEERNTHTLNDWVTPSRHGRPVSARTSVDFILSEGNGDTVWLRAVQNPRLDILNRSEELNAIARGYTQAKAQRGGFLSGGAME
eukprot:366069-Chlamydomonas_euryale.AAC.15